MSKFTIDPYQQRIRAAVTGETIGLTAPPLSQSFTRTYSVTLEEFTVTILGVGIFTAPSYDVDTLSTVGNFIPEWTVAKDVFYTDSFFPIVQTNFQIADDIQSVVEPAPQTPVITRTATVTLS